MSGGAFAIIVVCLAQPNQTVAGNAPICAIPAWYDYSSPPIFPTETECAVALGVIAKLKRSKDQGQFECINVGYLLPRTARPKPKPSEASPPPAPAPK